MAINSKVSRMTSVFIPLFNKYSFAGFCVPDVDQDPGDTVVDKRTWALFPSTHSLMPPLPFLVSIIHSPQPENNPSETRI